MRQGDNSALVAQIAKRLPCQVGGGIRTVERARQVLDAGAQARHHRLRALFRRRHGEQPKLPQSFAGAIGADHIVAGIDTKNGRIAVKGWKAEVALTPDEAIPQLEPHFRGFPLHPRRWRRPPRRLPHRCRRRLRKLTQKQLIVAGGIRSQQEIDALHALGADAVVGMADLHRSTRGLIRTRITSFS